MISGTTPSINYQCRLEKDLAVELSKYKVNMPVHINCDKEAKFDVFVILLDILKEKDFKNLGIITKKDS